jgi:hypothetical protein
MNGICGTVADQLLLQKLGQPKAALTYNGSTLALLAEVAPAILAPEPSTGRTNVAIGRLVISIRAPEWRCGNRTSSADCRTSDTSGSSDRATGNISCGSYRTTMIAAMRVAVIVRQRRHCRDR